MGLLSKKKNNKDGCNLEGPAKQDLILRRTQWPQT